MMTSANKHKPKFPSMRFGPNGATVIVNSEDETPKGWTDVWAEAVKRDEEDKWPKAPAAKAKDHDL